MNHEFRKQSTPDRGETGRYLQTIAGPIDSYLEDHIEKSSRYDIWVSGTKAGIVSIYEEALISLFALDTRFLSCAQKVYAGTRKLERVSAAFVSTSDAIHLPLALDDYAAVSKQAFLFQRDPATTRRAGSSSRSHSLRPARAEDVDFIRQHSGDFFGEVEPRLPRNEIFLNERDGLCVGFGVVERSPFQIGVASIGMFTIEAYRNQGVAVSTLDLLLRRCHEESLEPVAGCWYQNHASKRSLEKAGLISSARLLRFEFHRP